MGKLVWSNFEPLEDSPFFTQRDFAETFDGGQSFRFYETQDSCFEGVFENQVVRVKLGENGKILASFPAQNDFQKSKLALLNFVDFKRDYSQIIASQNDEKVLAAAKEFPTLRILRQSPQEAIICFICSSSKRIVQIKQCVKLLADNLGEPICEGFSQLPSFEKIANASDEVLKSCKLGFRASYLKKTAQKIVNDKFDPESLRQMPYLDAKKYLLTLTGVGEKVADCILLFGAAHFEAFPVDTWISKAMAALYNLKNPKDSRNFASQKFGANAGYIQQILFAKIRK